MRAVVISGNAQRSRTPGARWGALSPLVDRPFLQHVVECVVGHGVRELDFILPSEDRPARTMLGDGTRWGAQIEYYAPAADERVYDVFKRIHSVRPDELLLLIHSDRLPLLPAGIGSSAHTSVPTLFCWRDSDLRWTGWAMVRVSDLLALPQGIEEQDLFPHLLRNCGNVICCEGPRPLMAHSYEDLIEANRRVLTREFPGLLVSGKEVQPGVWMARNVTIHPTAKLMSPAFVGENSRVGALVQVGPVASIGRDCLIERETYVSNSVVCSGSYVGRHLSLRGVVVDRSRLINTRWDAEIDGMDELLLGSVFGQPLHTRMQTVCGRIAAAVGLIAAMPLLLAMFVVAKLGWIPSLRKDLMVRTPSVADSFRWLTFPLWTFGGIVQPEGQSGWVRHFFFTFTPGLISIAQGNLNFAGLAPQAKEQLENATEGEQSRCLRSRPGLLQADLWPDNDGLGIPSHRNDSGWRESRSLLLRYSGSVLRNCWLLLMPAARTPTAKSHNGRRAA